MSSPTRFTKIGTSGGSGKTGKSDAYQQTFEIATPIVATTATQTTTIQLPSVCVIEAAFLHVINAEVTGLTKTIDIGLSLGGSTDIAASQSVSDAGLFALSGGVTASQDFVTYTLGSADFVEFEGELVVRATAVNG